MVERVHVVIVGGGITGLATAVAYAKNADVSSCPVLLLEKEPKVGGMVTSFKRQGYLFDTVQMIPDISRQLEYLGVDLPLKRFDGCCARVFIADPASGRAKRIDIPSGVEPFREMLMSRYGNAGKAAARMVNHSAAMFDELRHLRLKSSLLGDLGMLLRCRRIVASANLTFEQYMNKLGVTDPDVREVFDVFAAFGGLPAERVSALFIAGAMTGTLRGSYRPTSGFIKLPHRLRKRAESLGVTVRCKSPVEQILTENGTVTGVRLVGGEIIEANYIVTAMDTKAAMLQLLGDDILRQADPVYADRVHRVRMSPSSMTISLGLDNHIDLEGLGMDCGYNVITTGRGTFEKLFQAFDRGETAYSDTCFHTAAICPSLTTGGKPTLIIRVVPMPMADWTDLRTRDPDAYARRKREIAGFFIAQVERYLVPELARHINAIDISSPATFERYVGTPTGSNYDMSPYPDNFGRKRLKMQTPIVGLLHPKFTHSIYGALLAGLHAADHILDGSVTGGRSSL